MTKGGQRKKNQCIFLFHFLFCTKRIGFLHIIWGNKKKGDEKTLSGLN